MRIQHNIMAMNAYRNYSNNTSALSKNLEKLSSGYKINRAGDDAAGLAISEKMRAQITGLDVAQKNAKDGISLVQTAEGALTEVHDMLNRMVELATQSANGTYDNTTDRDNLQKEVDQLLEEIDRIADSSNFNGINLLDGTLGLNQEAFDISSAAAVTASDGTIDLSSLFGNFHDERASATQTPPSASIDLGNLAINDVADQDTPTIDITIAGKKLTVTLTQNTSGNNKNYTATDIAAALKTAIQGDSTLGVKTSDGTHDGTTTTNNNGIRIGDAIYTIGGTGSEITLTYAGYMQDGNTFKAATAGYTEDEANAMNTALGFEVKAENVTNGTQAGDVVHATTKVTEAVAAKTASLAGIDLKLTADMIVQGGTLTIDGKTFMFQTEATAPTATNGETIINVSKGQTDEERIHMAVDLLSQQTAITGSDGTRQFVIASKTDDTIHIEQKVASTAGKELATQTDLTSLISAKGQKVNAANVGTKITIDDSKVIEGDALTIDGKKYVFTNDAAKLATTGGDITYVEIAGGAGKNLADKVSGSTYDEADNSVTVRAATADDAAPMVLGGGLTLQIGDTSEDFNQLNVLVQDMHADSLGINGLSISDQTSARAAIDKIKTAINTVSSVRGTLGATQNRLDHTINNLSVMQENIQDAESTIRDTDVADEMMAYTNNNILIQSAQAMLAQANQVPQGVLQLLQ